MTSEPRGRHSELEGTSWLVTGAARGIGEAIARLALSRGARVLIADLDVDAGEALVTSLRAAGQQAIFHRADVTDSDALQSVITAVEAAFGGLDVLVNNAGIHDRMISPSTDIQSMDLAAFLRVLEVNLVAVWNATKLALPLLMRSGHASVINAASTAALTGYPASAAYGASKGGVAVLTKCLAVDLAAYGIRVNAYCPGSIETRMIADLIGRQPDREVALARGMSTHLVRRYGRPSDVAELVCFLASERASFITGALVNVDGGSLAWRGTVDSLPAFASD